jgi:hypothetical protein
VRFNGLRIAMDVHHHSFFSRERKTSLNEKAPTKTSSRRSNRKSAATRTAPSATKKAKRR